MQVRFWGTRGSLPVAPQAADIRDKIADALVAANGRSFPDRAAATAYLTQQCDFAAAHSYGGATSCVEIDVGEGAFIVCDMGSGLREFGLDSLRRCATEDHPREWHVFLSHLHWDHIMGFPFFVPGFIPGSKIVIHAGHAEAEHALRRQQEEISFPVPFDFLKADFEFRTLEPGRDYRIGAVTVSVIEQQHSHASYGYRIIGPDGKSAIYATDSEHKIDSMEDEREVASFFADADLAICDTMYSLADSVAMKEDWGHSSNIVVIDLCHRAAVKRLALFHHEPTYSDADIQRMHRESIRYEELTREEAPLEVVCAYDGLSITL